MENKTLKHYQQAFTSVGQAFEACQKLLKQDKTERDYTQEIDLESFYACTKTLLNTIEELQHRQRLENIKSEEATDRFYVAPKDRFNDTVESIMLTEGPWHSLELAQKAASRRNQREKRRIEKSGPSTTEQTFVVYAYSFVNQKYSIID